MKKVLTIGRVLHVGAVRIKKTQDVRGGVPWFTYQVLTPEDPDLNVWEEDV